MTLSYRIIYPRGNRKQLDVAQVRDYEAADWALASRRQFEEEAEAIEYAKELAESTGIPYRGRNSEPDYLD